MLAAALPESRWTLLERQVRRCRFLIEQVGRLELAGRVEVLNVAAEDAARTAERRGQYELVTARSFGPPPLTAEYGAPFLAVGGHLLVADPPGGAARWAAAGLAAVGLVPESGRATAVSIAVMRQIEPCPDAYPRRSVEARRHPIF